MVISPKEVKSLGTYEVREGGETKKVKVYKTSNTYFTEPVDETFHITFEPSKESK